MNKLNAEQLKQIINVGEDTFSIKVSDAEVNAPFGNNEDRFIKTLLGIEVENLTSFLDFHYNHSSFKTYTLHFIHKALDGTKVNKKAEMRSKVYIWLEQKSGISIRSTYKANNLLVDRKWNNKKMMEKWPEEFAQFSNLLVEEEKASIYAYCLALLNEALEIHNLSILNPSTDLLNNFFDTKRRYIQKEQSKLDENENTSFDFNRIEWLGTQKQLAELLVVLQKKGWISQPEYKAIKVAFTKSNTIEQVLKPSTDRKTKQAEYDQIYTANYSPKFAEIMENPKAPKKDNK